MKNAKDFCRPFGAYGCFLSFPGAREKRFAPGYYLFGPPGLAWWIAVTAPLEDFQFPIQNLGSRINGASDSGRPMMNCTPVPSCRSE